MAELTREGYEYHAYGMKGLANRKPPLPSRISTMNKRTVGGALHNDEAPSLVDIIYILHHRATRRAHQLEYVQQSCHLRRKTVANQQH